MTPPRATAALFHGPSRGFELRKIPLPASLRSGEVLVKIRLATLCGSDLHTVQGRRPVPLPCVLGHEAVGLVVDKGENREDCRIGQRITWSLTDSCGKCSFCAQYERPEKCSNVFKYGHEASTETGALNGCYATHILLRPGTAIEPLPDELSDAQAAPANCALATIAHVLEQVPPRTQSVLVQGAGLLGLYACGMLRQRGVPRLFCSDPVAERLQQVREFGAIPVDLSSSQAGFATHLRQALPDGFDAIIEVAGVPGAVSQGLEVIRTGGAYLWAGLVHPQTELRLSGELIVKKCLSIIGIHNYSPRHLRQAVGWLHANRDQFPWHQLVSAPVPLDRIQEAFALAQGRTWPRVAITPDSPD